MNLLSFPRIIYLAAQFHPQLPSKDIISLVPQNDLIAAVVSRGVQGASAELDIPFEQVENLFLEGKGESEGNEEEFRALLSQVMMAELELHRDEMSMSVYLAKMKAISSFMDSSAKNIVTHETLDLGSISDDDEVTRIPKFNTGFDPFDVVTGGLYQAILTVIARPGHGKTSLLLSMMEACRTSGCASSLWYYEQEVPMAMMRYRLSPCAKRTQFISGKDRLICGSLPIDAIEAEVRADPDPDRIIFIDSPDVMAGGAGETKRFAIEEIYMGLIRLKQVSKLIVVTSWPRRKDTHISLESGAEAWAKAWYSDIILGIAKMGRAPIHGMTNVKVNVPKNRFGPADNELTFQYHYGNLSWEVGELARTQMNMEGDDW